MSLLYSSMLIHGFLPDAMMITIIAPIIKNKVGDLSDNNNYRPIALATILSKLFESLILSRVSTFLSTCVNQFGFKKHHSTEMLIFLLKELFRNYIANGSSMYVTMLDANDLCVFSPSVVGLRKLTDCCAKYGNMFDVQCQKICLYGY